MSGDFLSRWSRRKHAATAEPKAPTRPEEAAHAAGDETALVKPEPSTAEASTAPAELPFDLTSLPPIESITAATDIRPFLAPGVPLEIARAALRRAWSADPAIRNFVGLAEYAWDYHTPGSMAGFGPLEMTEELRQVVARIVGGGPAELAADVTEDVTEHGSDDGPAVQKPPLAVAAADSNRTVTLAEPANSQSVASSSDHPAAPGSKHPAEQQEPVEHEIGPSIVRRNHGGALPK